MAIASQIVKKRKKTSTAPDLATAQGLAEYAKTIGLERQAEELLKKPKLSFLQRLGTGLSALNPAEAIATGMEKGLGAGLLAYPRSIAERVGEAVTGREIGEQSRYFGDIAEKLGVENGIAKFGIGFLGDVLLDPSTYFGGAIAKGITGTAKAGAKIGVKGIGKVAPELGENLIKTGESLQDALGKAFVAGYKTTDGLKAKVMETLGKTAKAKFDVAEQQFSKLGTGVLTDEQNTEVFMRLAGGKRLEQSLRAKGLTAAKAGEAAIGKATKGATGQVKETVGKILERGEQIGQEVFGDDFYRSYMPFLRKDKLDKIFKEIDRTGLRVGSEGYTKQFKNLLTDDELEKNVAQLFFTTDSKIATNKIIRESLNDIVDTMGKPLTAFKTADEAEKAGYKLLKENGIFGKEVGYVSKWDYEFLTGQLDGGFKTIDMIAKATGFDAVTQLFKRSVTGLFAPFHIRNFVSGMVQNFEVLGKDALLPQNIASGQKLALAAIGKTTLKENDNLFKAFEPFLNRFGASSFYKNEFDNALKAGESLAQYQKTFSKGALKTTLKTAGMSSEGIPFKIARSVGNYIELQQKGTAYVTALGQGKSIAEALNLAEKAGFDYRVLTQFESSILRRIVPFYSFTRKNIELQLRTLGESPERINQVIRLVSNMGEKAGEEELEGIPDYVKEGFAIKMPDTVDGLKVYLTSLGTPIEQFAGLFKENNFLNILSQTNPILKVPIELGIGKDSFRQKDIKDTYDAKEYKLAPQILKDFLEIKPVEKPIYERLPNGELKKTGTRIQYVANPEKLLIARSLFTSRGVTYLDQVFGGDLKGLNKFLKLFTGLKPQEFDLELGKSLKERDQKRALEDLILKYSNLGKFEKLYEKK
jgi:hypothetical protein